jgi:hypothetical protein
MLAQLEKEFLQADAAQVRALLAQCTPLEDPIEYFQYSQRLAQLEASLAVIGDSIDAQPAAAALFFGGAPVVGSHGIQARFGSLAVAQFQKLVSQRFAANEQGPLASRGRVPLADETRLLITDVVRGSFGFVLQQANSERGDEGHASLKTVVDEVADTLSRIASADEALFDENASKLDDRQLATLRDFFKLLDDEGASLRLVEGDRDLEFDRAAIARARIRAESLSIEDRVEERVGKIVGWTQYSHRFELQLDGDGGERSGAVIAGLVSRDVMHRAVEEGMNPLNRHFKVRLGVREMRSHQRAARYAYTLRNLEPIETPDDGWDSARNSADPQ